MFSLNRQQGNIIIFNTLMLTVHHVLVSAAQQENQEHKIKIILRFTDCF